MKRFGELVYSRDNVPEKAASKAESHTPRIEAPERVRKGEAFEVKVSVGPHPSTPQHSIMWIDLYFYEEGRGFNPIHIARIEFSPGYTEPVASVVVKLEKSGVLYAVGYCNLHGLWEARKSIVVE